MTWSHTAGGPEESGWARGRQPKRRCTFATGYRVYLQRGTCMEHSTEKVAQPTPQVAVAWATAERGAGHSNRTPRQHRELTHRNVEDADKGERSRALPLCLVVR